MSSAERRTRADNRAHMEAEILRLGRTQLATRGPAALSLREVARELGVASSAVYRYVADRDALLTRLVVDAYTDLADYVETALASVDSADHSDRLACFALAMRAWAVANPARWGLIYGTPVPGYAAPEAATTPPGTRLMTALAVLTADAAPTPAQHPARLDADYQAFLKAGAAELGLTGAVDRFADAVEAWCAIVGTVSMEVFGQLGPEVSQIGEALLRRTVAGLVARHTAG